MQELLTEFSAPEDLLCYRTVNGIIFACIYQNGQSVFNDHSLNDYK